MVERTTYGKQEIIRMAMDHTVYLEYTGDSVLEDRLDAIIEFLNEGRVQKVIVDSTKGLYGYQMDEIVKAKGRKLKEYNFTLKEAIFLAVLIALFNQPFFKKMRIKSKIKDRELYEAKGLELFSLTLELYKSLWNEKGNGEPWEYTWLYLGTVFYNLLLLDDYAEEIQSEINMMVTLFEGLPDEHKIKIYEKSMKNRIKHINTELTKYIKNLKENNPEEYTYYQKYKNIIDIDKKFASDEG